MATTFELRSVTDWQTADFAWHGGVREFVNYREQEAIIHGPAECISGETGIFVPSMGREVQVKELYQEKKPFDVLTLFGSAIAEPPFIKGCASLYRVTSETGLSFTATAKHIVMTKKGWSFVSDLSVGDSLPEFAVSPLLSSSEPVPLWSQPSVDHWRKTVSNCQESYSDNSHLCDGRLHRQRVDGPMPHSSQACVCECNHGRWRLDVQAYEQEHTHSCQLYNRPSNLDYWSQSGRVQDDQYRIAPRTPLRDGDLSRLFLQSLNMSGCPAPSGQRDQSSYNRRFSCIPLTLSLDVLDNSEYAADLIQDIQTLYSRSLFQRRHEEYQPFVLSLDVCIPSLHHLLNPYYTVQWSHVSSIEFVADDVFFDFRVPNIGHYIADGFLHHNTGKTLGALWKLHNCALAYPGASIVIMRKTLTSTYSTVLQTFRNKVLGPDEENWPCTPYGGEKPEWFAYANGSRIWVTGMDKASRVLSAEHDLILWNQVEEATLDEWEVCTTRTTGRAGNMPYSQTIGDCNPAWPLHWIYNRESLRIFYSRHEENPSLYDQVTGQITEQGRRTMAVLNALTGIRRTRFLEGRPAQAEGVIYDEWDDAVHLVYSAPACFRHVAGVDWGYRNPGVIGVFGVDGLSGAMYLKAQIYRTGKTDDWWLERAKELHGEFGIEAFVCDPSQPAYIDKFRAAGLNAVPGFNAVMPGITATKTRLAGSGFYIVRDSSRYEDEGLKAERKPWRVQDEFPGYVWADKKSKEQPVKENDDGLDMSRYTVAYIDGLEHKEPEEELKEAYVWGQR